MKTKKIILLIKIVKNHREKLLGKLKKIFKDLKTLLMIISKK